MVATQNMLLKMGISKETIIERKTDIKKYLDKIDNATLYEFINWDITEEQLQEEMTKYVPKKKKSNELKPNTIETLKAPNPSTMHEWNGTSPWSRCIYCGWLKKYDAKKECPRYIENVKEEEKEEEKNEEKA